MGSSSKPNFPSPPGFEANPFVEPNIGFLSSVGQSLARGGFMPGQNINLPKGFENVDLGFLEENVTLNPAITQRAVGLATRDITDRAEKFRQQTINQLEANNQLTSSVANTSLQEINEAFNADIADVATTFYLADVERALTSRLGLFELGLNTTGQATQLGQEQQRQENAAIQTQYNNQVALEAERFNRALEADKARAQTVGFFTGPAGGAIYGGLNSGTMGAQAGLSGGIQGANFFSGGMLGNPGGLNASGGSDSKSEKAETALKFARFFGGVA